MRTKITIDELYNGIKDYFNLDDIELFDINKKNMEDEINNLKDNNAVTCNSEYSVVFDAEALYIEFFDDLIKIPFKDGIDMIYYLKQAHIEYVPVDFELPIIKDIFGYKLKRKKVRSR